MKGDIKIIHNNFYRNDLYFKSYPHYNDDVRLGGFLAPFIAGAAITAPFWFIAGNNKQYNNYPPYYYYPYYR